MRYEARSVFPAGRSVAVFGALPDSLGDRIARDLSVNEVTVTTIGPGRVVLNPKQVEEGYEELSEAIHDVEWVWPGHYVDRRVPPDLTDYDNLVITMGVNMTEDEDPWGYKQMEVNYHGPMALAREWQRLGKPGHCVVISSNSAHIARSPSAGYCASKAALSMGIRCVARDSEVGVFYAWEFGLLEGTPMTADTVRRVGPDVPLTRMRRQPLGIPVADASAHVCNALAHGWHELNGVTLRVDGGEQ